MVRLFIDNHEVELDKKAQDICITYQSTDTTDPTAVKNSFSKSIVLKGTATNNSIFGAIYQLDRNTDVQDNIFYRTNFDSRKRVPFVLYDNSDIVDKGYMQMDSITIDKGVPSYSISLYGTLGDFFYNLQNKVELESDDESLTLADLTYNITNEDGIILPWTKAFILDGWNGLKDPNHVYTYPLAKYVKAIPTYSGNYDDFENDTVMVNNVGLNGKAWKYFPPIRSGSTDYITVEDWSLVRADRELEEWECRDLRSMYQRPAVKMSWILNAISEPYNNGGYNVVWDEDIVNSDYYDKTWILLKRINFDDSDLNVIERYDFGFDTEGASPISTTGYTLPTTIYPYMYENGVTTVHEDGTLDYTLRINHNVNYGGYQPQTYWKLKTTFEVSQSPSGRGVYKNATVLSGVLVRQIVNSASTYMFIYCGADLPRTGSQGYDSYDWWKSKVAQKAGISVDDLELVNSQMEYTDSSVTSSYVNRSLNVAQGDKVSFQFSTMTLCSSDDLLDFYSSSYYSTFNPRVTEVYNIESNRLRSYNINNSDKVTSGIYTGEINPDIQPVNVTKKMLFDTDASPFDYLVWFTKCLNLRYRYDKAVKTIYIEPMYKYYLDEVVNIDDKIDRGSTIEISPNVSENKFYKYGFPTPETYAAKIYKSKVKMDYGTMKKDTGYDFDRSTNDLFEDCVYQNGIPYSHASVLFNNEKDGDYTLPSIALLPKFKQVLWSVSDGNEEEFDVVGYSGNINVHLVRKRDTTYPKICAFDDDNSMVDDVTNVLLFYDGEEDVRGMHFLLTDNMRMMKELVGQDSACHIYSESETYGSRYGTDTDQISILQSIPKFNKCLTGNDGTYRSSWNFAKPDMTFIADGGKYNSDCTLYDKFWKRYINDMFHTDNKRVECSVFLPDTPDMALRKFYYFGNSYWILTKVTDYNPDSNRPVKCEFTKIINKANYTSSAPVEMEELTSTTTAAPEPPMPVYAVEPLAFINVGDVVADVYLDNKSGNTPNVEYSTDYRNWSTWNYSTLEIPVGGAVYFRGTNASGFNHGTAGSAMTMTSWSIFKSTKGSIKLSGNLESLNNYSTETKIGGTYHGCFGRLFSDNYQIVDAYDLDLHLTKINGEFYYRNLLGGCINLVTAPMRLPATGLSASCYVNFFINCSKLVNIPDELPATTLKDYCYQGMFYGTKITATPSLPAPTLVNNCYKQMFDQCSSLTECTAYFTTTPTTAYTQNWVRGVASSGTFYKSTTASWNVTGNYGIPTNWSVTSIDPTTTTTETTTTTLESKTYRYEAGSGYVVEVYNP